MNLADVLFHPFLSAFLYFLELLYSHPLHGNENQKKKTVCPFQGCYVIPFVGQDDSNVSVTLEAQYHNDVQRLKEKALCSSSNNLANPTITPNNEYMATLR